MIFKIKDRASISYRVSIHEYRQVRDKAILGVISRLTEAYLIIVKESETTQKMALYRGSTVFIASLSSHAGATEISINEERDREVFSSKVI